MIILNIGLDPVTQLSSLIVGQEFYTLTGTTGGTLLAIKYLNPEDENDFYFKVISQSTGNERLFSGNFSGILFKELGEVILKKNSGNLWEMTVEHKEFNKADISMLGSKKAVIGYWIETAGDLETGLTLTYTGNSDVNTQGRVLTLSRGVIANQHYMEIPAVFGDDTFGDAINKQPDRNNVDMQNKYQNAKQEFYVSTDPCTYTILV